MKEAIKEQLNKLQIKFPNSEVIPLGNGSHILTVKNIPIPKGNYNKDHIDMSVLLPVGYPMASPSQFYVDEDLRQNDGSLPYMSATQYLNGNTVLWVAYRILDGYWNANKHDLLTYIRAMLGYFQSNLLKEK